MSDRVGPCRSPTADAEVAAGTARCTVCLRAVPREQQSVMPIGWTCLCSICGALAQIQDTVTLTRLSPAQEEEVVRALRYAYDLVRIGAGQ